ncbi:hypothetical protein [Marinobacterium jannaschii]|uniref:hypothetical protein n=1 Tax=Marinobacterium jannaschii TaxID=64970 RepID=UPI000482D15C|nr:hypothetical protein [Marinobacterium jannaschii]
MSKYIIANAASWGGNELSKSALADQADFILVSSPDELVAQLSPGIEAIFFVHWRWIVKDSILQKYRCVCFHMTDLPYGRGGSPLQNLILRGFKETVLSALEMTSEIDGGPVYCKRPLSLAGSAEEIYCRMNTVAYEIIVDMVHCWPSSKPQEGEVTYFTRRQPHMSRIPSGMNGEELYDFIRMLDAEGYPRAYIEHDGCRYTFSNAKINGDEVSAEVKVTTV